MSVKTVEVKMFFEVGGREIELVELKRSIMNKEGP
jgi:hypothetical protein